MVFMYCILYNFLPGESNKQQIAEGIIMLVKI